LPTLVGQVPSTEAKTKGPGEQNKEGIKSEDAHRNLPVTEEKWLEITPVSTCADEYLLKACASRQEKATICNTNSAPQNPLFHDFPVKAKCRLFFEA
jgi:hypothetical protein